VGVAWAAAPGRSRTAALTRPSSLLLNLIEGTRVAIDVDPDDGKLAAKITVVPDVQEPP
jgi:hypothetical protein